MSNLLVLKKCVQHSHACIILFLFSLLLCNCEKKEVEMEYEKMLAIDGETLKISKSPIIEIPNLDSCLLDTPYSKNDIEILYRYIDKREDKYWSWAKLGDWAHAYGLSSSSMYLVKKVYYSHFIPNKKGYLPIPFVPHKNEMGFIPQSTNKYIIGFRGSVSMPVEKLNGNSWTTIYYIGYDVNGKKIDINYPIPPENLKWYYSWFDYEAALTQ